MQPDATKIRALLKKTTHHDKDERYMATSDLTAELEKVDGHLDSALQSPIRDAILKQLDDASNDVQTVACRCLSQIVQKFNAEQVEEIVKKLALNLVEREMGLRDVYGIALQTTISSVSDDYGMAIAAQIVPACIEGLNKRKGTNSDDTAEEKSNKDRDYIDRNTQCLDILKELSNRFGYQMGQQERQTYHQDILDTLVPMLQHPNPDIRKKVGITLGALVSVLSNTNFHNLINRLIRTIQELDRENVTLYTYIQTIGTFSRNSGKRMATFLDEIVPLLLSFASEPPSGVTDGATDLHENILQAFETLILQCPTEIKQFTDQLLDLGLKMMKFDPNYNYEETGADQKMAVDGDDDDDDDWGSDDGDDEEGDWGDLEGGNADDDASWKVRQAALKMLTAYIQTHKASVQEYHLRLCDDLLVQFREREISCKGAVFSAFRELLMASIVAEEGGPKNVGNELNPFELPSMVRQVSAFNLMSEKLPQIMNRIAEQFDAKGKKEDQIKIRLGLLEIIRDLVLVRQANRSERCDPLEEGGMRSYFPMIMPKIVACTEEEDVNLKTKALYVIYLIFLRHDPAELIDILEQTYQVAMRCIGDQYSRVKTQALMIAARFMEINRPFVNGMDYNTDCDGMVRELFAACLEQLALKDIEQEVKRASLNAVAKCIAHFGDLLANDVENTLQTLVSKLNNEVTRQTALQAFTVIADSPLQVSLRSCVNEVVDISTPFLRQHLAALRHDTAIALKALIRNGGETIPSALTQKLITDSAEFINDADLHLCSLILDLQCEIMTTRKSSLQKIRDVVFPQTFNFLQSPLIQGRALNSSKGLFVTFYRVSENTIMPFEALKTELIRHAAPDLSRQAYNAISECLACLTLECEDATFHRAVAEYINLIGSQRDNEAQVALLCIGEIGRTRDLSRHQDLEMRVFGAFGSQSEQTKWAASFAFGTMSVGNLNRYVPSLLDLIDAHPERQYLLLNSLKQIIAIESATIEGQDSLRPYAETVVPLLLRNANSSDEGVRSMVSECLGRFACIQPSIFEEVENLLDAEEDTTRSTMAAALKYGVSQKNLTLLPDSTLVKFLNILDDPSVVVKRQGFLTLIAILPYSLRMKVELDRILPIVYAATVQNMALVHEVDLGPFKHRVDEGLPLRKASFQCMDTLLDACGHDLDLLLFLETLKIGILDESSDIQMLTYQIMARLAHYHGPRILPGLDALPTSLMQAIKAKLKMIKDAENAERTKDILRAAVKALYTMSNIPNVSPQSQFKNFYNRVQKTKVLIPMIAELKSEGERRG